jgi:hypothetical protein
MTIQNYIPSGPMRVLLGSETLRYLSQRLNRVRDNVVWHAVSNFNSPDGTRQNEVHVAVVRFLVGPQEGKKLAWASLHFGQRAEAENRVRNSLSRYAITIPHILGDGGSGNHSPSDRLAVQESPICGFGLQGVTDGVPEI